jgi:hypothetical protein
VWLDPYKRIFAGGYVNRNFTGGHPRKWVMKLELIFGIVSIPALIGMIVIGILSADDWSFETFAGLIYPILMAGLCVVFYYRVFKNYKRLYGAKRSPATN